MLPDKTGRLCYALLSKKLGWNDARDTCQYMDGNMVNITTAMEWKNFVSVQ